MPTAGMTWTLIVALLCLCGSLTGIIAIRCIMAAKNPPPAPVAQQYVIKTVEMQDMQENPMHTVAGTVAVQQVNPRKMDPAASSVSQI